MLEALVSNFQSLGIFLIILSILVVVHEWGHFITAKKCGVKVEKFSLGFGPVLWSKVHDGTEFLVSAIPLGGYVKMAGDERDSCKGTPDEFFSQPIGKRSLIVINGPVVNFILAYVCLSLVFMMGYPDLSTRVGKLIDGYPAIQAGLQEKDVILSINGKNLRNWSELQRTVSESKSSDLHLMVQRNDQTFPLDIHPKVEMRKNVFGQMRESHLIGIQPAEDVILVKYGFLESWVEGYKKLYEITFMTVKSIYFMLTGAMPAKENMTGPIGIFFIIKSAAAMGFVHLLLITGIISASLAIFNLIPMIPLDGGHLLLFAIEKIRGKALSPKIDEYIAKVGFSLIILLALFVFYSDFARFGWIDKIKHLFS